MEKVVIGRVAKVRFPTLGLDNIKARVDTGAYRSAIHCSHVRIIEKDGQRKLAVRFLDPDHKMLNHKLLIFNKFDKTEVLSSFGVSQERFVVELDVEINGRKHRAAFTLADRSKMKSPVLIGRTILAQNYLVDVSKSFKV